jgi:hypothetical protein
VPPHDFDHKGALVASRCTAQGIDGLGDAMQCGVSPDSHIRPENVIVNRAGQTDDADMRMPRSNLCTGATLRDEFGYQGGPFLVKQGSPTQAAIPANHYQVIDAMLQQITDRL